MSLKTSSKFLWPLVPVISGLFVLLPQVVFAAETVPAEGMAWWVWVLLLFVFSFCLGIVAVVAGVGGGVLYVPIVSSLFPFHLDFVRGAGLMVALAGALSAGAPLLKKGLANLKLALSMALIGSVSSIFGALAGLALPSHIIQLSLGFTIVFIAIIMLRAKKSEFPEVAAPDKLSQILHIQGIYYEESLKKDIDWNVHRTPVGLVLFVVIGFMAGMFGLGARIFLPIHEKTVSFLTVGRHIQILACQQSFSSRVQPGNTNYHTAVPYTRWCYKKQLRSGTMTKFMLVWKKG